LTFICILKSQRRIHSIVGFDFQPGTNDLYFTFLERDWLGNNQPDDYLDYIPLNATGKNFNWPYCHWIGQGNPDLRSPGPGNPIPDDFMVAPAEETYLSNHGIANNSLTTWCQGEYCVTENSH
jgi:glucose/arabinose dehydrogenase